MGELFFRAEGLDAGLAMCGAMLLLNGTWNKPGAYTLEEFDPDPFLDALDKWGLPRSESLDPILVE